MAKGLIALTLFIFVSAIVCPRDANAITLSEENELGAKIVRLIYKSVPLVEDGEILTYVNKVGARLVRQIGVTPYRFHFYVIDEAVPNAFAVPGGNIFIYRGIIQMMSSEDELASILAHELGHIVARHLQRSIDEQKITSIATLAGLVAGIFLGAPGLAVGGAAASQTAALVHSREHEMEADLYGFRYLCKAGYNPAAMPAMMMKLLHSTWLETSGIPDYLETHPATGERVLYLNQMVRKVKASHRLVRRPPVGDFKVIQAALIAEYSNDANAMTRFRAGIKKGEASAVYGLGCLYMRDDSWSQAVTQLKKAAGLMPDNPFVLSSLGEAYEKVGKLQEAQSTLESALMLDPSSAVAHYRMAKVLMDMGKKEEALDHLMQIEDLAPTFPQVDYQLGVTLGQLRKLGLAHYYLGLYYYRKENRKLAISHFKKAKSLIKDSPEKIEKIKEYLKEMEPKKKGFFSRKH